MTVEDAMLVGVDSATYKVVYPMLKELPTFEKVMKHGIYGELESTLPAMSPVAWASICSGKNPGKTGIFSFFRIPPPIRKGNESYTIFLTPISSFDVRTPLLWDILSKKGKRICVVGVPSITYPAKEVNGVLISGFPADKKSPKASYPRGFINHIKEAVGDFIITPYVGIVDLPGRERELFEEFNHAFNIYEQTLLYLQDYKRWHFFFPVIFMLDPIQHCFWRYFDQFIDRKKGGKAFSQVIPYFYKRIDNLLHKLMKECSGNILIVSDHGMRTNKADIGINELLRILGFLNFKRNLMARFKVILQRNIHKKFTCFIPTRFLNFFRWYSASNLEVNMTTKAIYLPYDILFLLDKRVKEDILIGIVSILKRFKVRANLFRRENIYKGPFSNNAPDIVIHSENVYFTHQIGTSLISKPLRGGEHSLKGIFMVYGSLVENAGKTAEKIDSSAYDVLPTLLKTMKISFPIKFDGKSIV